MKKEFTFENKKYKVEGNKAVEMKKYHIWIECKKEIEAESLDEAINKFKSERLEFEFNGVELK